jgi:hypothetical protein
MHRLTMFLLSSVLISAPSCGRTDLNMVVVSAHAGEGGTIALGGVTGSGGTTGIGGVVTGAGGAPASGGVVGTGGATSGSPDDVSTARTCNWPSCMTSAGKDCLPAGACIQQGSYSTGSANICYANGVKEIIGIDRSFNASMTVKNPTTTCFTMSGSVLPLLMGSGAAVTMSLQNGSGNVIGSVAQDLTTNQLTVTCTGSQPVGLDPACITGLSPSNACTSGTCLP